MRLEEAAHPGFAGHQTFHPRFGWIKKAYEGAKGNPDVFNDPHATVDLGVGKNMVEAIRFWGLAFKVIARIPKPDRRRISIAEVTLLGAVLLDDDGGWDPYLEDPATLWVLHWLALSAVSALPLWWIVFNDFSGLEFAESDLLEFAVDEVAATRWPQPNPSSIQKDIDCLLRMYAPRESRGRQTIDDLLDSPFRELGIIVSAPGERDRYRFVLGQKPGLPPEVIAFACLDYLGRFDSDARTSTLTRLATDPGSPGRILKLAEADLLEAIEKVAADHDGIHLGSPAGVTQLTFDADPRELATDLLHHYYSARRPGLPALGIDGVTARKAIPELPVPVEAVPTQRAGRSRRPHERIDRVPEATQRGRNVNGGATSAATTRKKSTAVPGARGKRPTVRVGSPKRGARR